MTVILTLRCRCRKRVHLETEADCLSGQNQKRDAVRYSSRLRFRFSSWQPRRYHMRSNRFGSVSAPRCGSILSSGVDPCLDNQQAQSPKAVLKASRARGEIELRPRLTTTKFADLARGKGRLRGQKIRQHHRQRRSVWLLGVDAYLSVSPRWWLSSGQFQLGWAEAQGSSQHTEISVRESSRYQLT